MHPRSFCDPRALDKVHLQYTRQGADLQIVTPSTSITDTYFEPRSLRQRNSHFCYSRVILKIRAGSFVIMSFSLLPSDVAVTANMLFQ